MDRFGLFLVKIAGVLFIIANGIMGIFEEHGGEYGTFCRFIFGDNAIAHTFLIFISISAFVAGIIILLSLFPIKLPTATYNMLAFYIFGWVSFVVVMDIIYPIFNKVYFFDYFKDLSTHLLAQGALFATLKRFNKTEFASFLTIFIFPIPLILALIRGKKKQIKNKETSYAK